MLEAFLLFGAIISTTDSVPIIAHFKELGVQHKIITMLEAESLLNNGLAIVLFTILIEMVEGNLGNLSTSGEFVLMFIRLLFGGLILGLLSAIILT